jgi:hypothetical protein
MNQNFPNCPLCNFPSSFIDIEGDDVKCINCDSQWHFDWRGNGEPTMTLIKEGKEYRGRLLVGKGHDVEFWRKMARSTARMEPMKPLIKAIALIAGIVVGLVVGLKMFGII